jgi:EmrB/QacA subfamily drug resistance transporter
VLPKDSVEPSESFDWFGMLMLSPGLAAFLYGVSSIPEHGTVTATEVWLPALAGLALIVAFVPWALHPRNIHPLVELRLFKNRDMTIAVVAMMLFAIAFFGSSLLFPLYFQEIRAESALSAGWLIAPQGFGAMITMPIAGMLADRIGPGKVVLAGIATIVVGMVAFTQLTDTTSYPVIIGALFVMGLGMGSTMMPIMSAALATLTDQNIARGSTLMNITQQVASSIGFALFSVLLTNGIQDAIGEATAEQAPNPLPFLAGAYADAFLVAVVLVAACLVPSLFLPRRKVAPVDPAALIGH